MEFTIELKVALIHMILGVFIGYVSSILTSNFTILLLMIVVLIATGQAVQRLLTEPSLIESTEQSDQTRLKEPKYNVKWWLKNGAYPYIIFWLFAWIVFYNL